MVDAAYLTAGRDTTSDVDSKVERDTAAVVFVSAALGAIVLEAMVEKWVLRHCCRIHRHQIPINLPQSLGGSTLYNTFLV